MIFIIGVIVGALISWIYGFDAGWSKGFNDYREAIHEPFVKAVERLYGQITQMNEDDPSDWWKKGKRHE